MRKKKCSSEQYEWWKVIESRSMESADSLNPQRVFCELPEGLHENIILSCYAGTAINWYGNTIKMRRGMMGSLSGSLATMGPAVPYAIAAKFAYPGIPNMEPAVYLEGKGGIRLNDNVLVKTDGNEVLSSKFLVISTGLF